MSKTELAVWTTKFINDLPDSGFLFIESGGKKDSQGKTVPRGLRHLPYKDASGKVDRPHLRNAIARIPQSNAKGLSPEKKRSLQEKARGILEKANKSAQASRVAVASEGRDFAAASGQETQEGQLVQRFQKDLIQVGVYTHPVHNWTLDVTTDRMDRWIAAFRRMKENGVDVEVVVDHRLEADATQGYLIEMFRDGETLYGIHEMRGQEAIELAQRVKNVSVLVEKEFVDGKGESYGEAITHSSIVQQPVVPGQEGFVPIAASKGSAPTGGVPIFTLSTLQETTMNEEMLNKLRELLGAGEDLNAENVLSRIDERLKAHADEKTAADKKLTDLAAEVESLKAKAPGTNEPKPDPDVIDGLAETAEDKIDGLAEKAKITPAVAASLKTILVGPAEKRNAYALSRKVSGTAQSLTKQIIAALDENDPVKLGEQTKSQSLTLSRSTPGGEKDVDPEVTKEMVEMGGGPEKTSK